MEQYKNEFGEKNYVTYTSCLRMPVISECCCNSYVEIERVVREAVVVSL